MRSRSILFLSLGQKQDDLSGYSAFAIAWKSNGNHGIAHRLSTIAYYSAASFLKRQTFFSGFLEALIKQLQYHLLSHDTSHLQKNLIWFIRMVHDQPQKWKPVSQEVVINDKFQIKAKLTMDTLSLRTAKLQMIENIINPVLFSFSTR